MKTVQVVPGSGRPLLVETKEPGALGSTQVRVKVLTVGLCRTDHGIMRGTTGRPPSGSRSLIPGHEMAGRAVELGKDVRRVRPGDLVVPTVRRGCGICASCLGGQPDLCYNGQATDRGVWEAQGFLAEYIVEDEANLVVAPLRFQDVAVLVEPLSQVIKAAEALRLVQQRLPARCGHPEHGWDQPRWAQCKRVLVAGTRACGLLFALFLRAAGAEVYVYSTTGDQSPQARIARLASSQYMAAERVPGPLLSQWVSQVDIVVDCLVDPDLLLAFLPVMARNAALVVMGRLESPRWPLGAIASEPTEGDRLRPRLASGWAHLWDTNRCLIACSGANRQHFESAVALLRRLVGVYPNTLPQLITHRFPLTRVADAFRETGPSAIKVVVDVA